MMAVKRQSINKSQLQHRYYNTDMRLRKEKDKEVIIKMNNSALSHNPKTDSVDISIETDMAFLDTKAVAEHLGCSLPTARQIMYRPDFPLIKVGKNLRVERSALREWAQKRRV